MLFDSKSYWSLLLFWFTFSPLTAKSSHAGFRSAEIAFRPFEDAGRAPEKNCSRRIPLWVYTYWFRSQQKCRHRVGVEWSAEIRGGGGMTLRRELSVFSGSKSNIWLDSAPKNTNPAKETAGVGSRQPSKQTPPALLAPDTICSRSYSSFRVGILAMISVCRRKPHCHAAWGQDEKEEVNNGVVTVPITDTHPMNTFHCYPFGHCT